MYYWNLHIPAYTTIVNRFADKCNLHYLPSNTTYRTDIHISHLENKHIINNLLIKGFLKFNVNPLPIYKWKMAFY